MRTSFTVAPDIADKLLLRVRKSRRSMASVVNDLLREALAEKSTDHGRPAFKVEPFPLGLKPGYDPDRLNEILANLETEER